MANPVNINVGALQRPGVFVTQSSTGGLPQPLASHAIGYIFGSTPTDPYDDQPVDTYASLPPYEPTQVGSLADFVQKAGGVPTAENNAQSVISYDAVNAFFENVGVNGILYYTRVTPTPELKVVLTKGAGWNLFSIKLNDRYFGDKSLGINDNEGYAIRGITTTALDANDNAFDIVGYLKEEDPDFSTYYRIEQTDEEAKAATFRIYSKDVRVVPEIQSFKGYQISDTAYATPTDAATISTYVPIKELNFRPVSRDIATQEAVLPISGAALGAYLEEVSKTTTVSSTDTATDIVTVASVADLSIPGTVADPLAAGDSVVIEGIDPGQSAYAGIGVDTQTGLTFGETYYVTDVSGNTFKLAATNADAIANAGAGQNFVNLNTTASVSGVRVRRLKYDFEGGNPASPDAAVRLTALSDAIEGFLLNAKVYSAISEIPSGKVVAVTLDSRTGKAAHIMWPDEEARYFRWDGTSAFARGFDGSDADSVPNGIITSTGGNVTRSGYVPDSVQVFYVNVAGENRAIIANGATPAELTDDIVKSLEEILKDKELDAYYDIESVAIDFTADGLSDNEYAPNNGIAITKDITTAGVPELRASASSAKLTGTLAYAGSGTTISGTTGDDLTGTVQVSAESNTVVTAGNFATGSIYVIKTVGTTDFTAIGASANTVGVEFTATGPGTGDGEAYDTKGDLELAGTATQYLSQIAPGQNLLVSNKTYEVVEVFSDTSASVKPSGSAAEGAPTVAAGATFKIVTTNFTEELSNGDFVVIAGVRYQLSATPTRDDQFEVAVAPTAAFASNTVGYLDSSEANGYYRHDYLLKVKITSKNGIPSPVVPGLDRYGKKDENIRRVNSPDEAADFVNYKLSAKARAQDFIYAIEQGMGSGDYRPGFLFAPEAFGSFVAQTGGLTKTQARTERVKVTQALLKAAEGKLGEVEGISGTQHIALIDCGGDELSLSEVQDELAYIKSVAGAPFGHAAFYGPYIKNAADRFVPPSPFIAGIGCSRYVNEGFQQAPAGARYPLRGAIGLRFDITAQQQEVTYPLGLNPIRSLPNRGIVAWGARTTSSNALFKYVNTRAILNVLLDVMARSFDDVLFEQIDSAGTLYSRAKSIASQVMGQLYRQGALFGARPEQAYLVVCSDANNSLTDLENGTLRLDAYVATSPTLERLVVTVVRTPAGQVAQVQDTFSRNVDRFDYLLNATTI